MPRIINAYSNGADSIADSLRELGQSIFGDQAQKELIRQNALAKMRENESIGPAADALAHGDVAGAIAAGVRAGMTGSNAADWNRLHASDAAHGNIDDPNLATAMLGAGGAAASTGPGQSRALANQRSIEAARDASTAATQEAIAARTLVPVMGPDGNLRYSQSSQAAGQSAPMSTDQIVGGVLRNSMAPQSGSLVPQSSPQPPGPTQNPAQSNSLVPQGSPQPLLSVAPATIGPNPVPFVDQAGSPSPSANAPPSAPPVPQPAPQPPAAAPAPVSAPAAPAPPNADPFANVPPAVLKKAGLYINPATYVEPQTGRTGISRDGGHTVIPPTGIPELINGSSWTPISNEGAIQESRAAAQRASVAAPPPPVADPTQSAAAADARTASGLDAFGQEHLNSFWGSIPGVAPTLKNIWPNSGGQIGPGYEAARNAQAVRNNEARTALLAAPGRQSVQAQKWVTDLLPEAAALTNPEEEAQKIPIIVNALQQDQADERRVIGDINTPMAERTAAIARLHKIESAITRFTQPPASAAGQPAQPAAAPPGSTQSTSAQPSPQPGGLMRVTGDASYALVPRGAPYIAPDGQKRIKQ